MMDKTEAPLPVVAADQCMNSIFRLRATSPAFRGGQVDAARGPLTPRGPAIPDDHVETLGPPSAGQVGDPAATGLRRASQRRGRSSPAQGVPITPPVTVKDAESSGLTLPDPHATVDSSR